MDMITQTPQERILEAVKEPIDRCLKPDLVSGDYVTLHEHRDEHVERLVTHSLQQAFETLDETFKHSRERRAHYYTKGKRPRTIMTVQGEVRFEREYYVLKNGGEGFFYVDCGLGLPGRDYYAPLVKASVLDGSGKISYAQAGRVAGETIGRRLKHREEAKRARISEATKDQTSPPGDHWMRDLFKNISYGGNPLLDVV